MEVLNADTFLIRAGFVLFILALLTGFLIPVLLNKKMALAAHVTGIMNALVLIVLGLAWGLLAVSPLQASLIRAAFLYATYVNWISSCLAAAWGTNRQTPVAGAGYGAAPWKETVVQGLQASLGLAILAGAILVVYALR
jgi:hydroxylaminobenzene mutase